MAMRILGKASKKKGRIRNASVTLSRLFNSLQQEVGGGEGGYAHPFTLSEKALEHNRRLRGFSASDLKEI